MNDTLNIFFFILTTFLSACILQPILIKFGFEFYHGLCIGLLYAGILYRLDEIKDRQDEILKLLKGDEKQ